MPDVCIIPGCKSRYSSTAERVSLFRVPKDPILREKWVKAVTPLINKLKTTHKICEKHFKESDIVRHFIHKDGDGQIIAQVAFKVPKLAETAVPLVFASPPNLDHKMITAAAVESQRDNELQPTVQTTAQNSVGTMSENVFPTLNNQSIMPVEKVSGDVETIATNPSSVDLTPTTPLPTAPNVMSIEADCNASEQAISKIDIVSQDNEMSSTRDMGQNSGTSSGVFIEIYNDSNAVELPLGWFRYTSNSGAKRWVAFSTFDVQNKLNCLQPVLRKSILLTEEGDVHVSANGKSIPTGRICHSLDRVCSIEDLSRLLTSFVTLISITPCFFITSLWVFFNIFRVPLQTAPTIYKVRGMQRGNKK